MTPCPKGWPDYVMFCPSARALGRLDRALPQTMCFSSDAAGYINGEVIKVSGGLDWAP
ncbi:MAG: hypothetical protein U5L05_18195 [Rubrivivax sp.]|nr:hypothetical protein [Rubrivivax sp.]